MSAEQAQWIAQNWRCIRAITLGIGSGGHPPPPAGYALVFLQDDSMIRLHPDGRTERA